VRVGVGVGVGKWLKRIEFGDAFCRRRDVKLGRILEMRARSPEL
jgi:hypothetical protein